MNKVSPYTQLKKFAQTGDAILIHHWTLLTGFSLDLESAARMLAHTNLYTGKHTQLGQIIEENLNHTAHFYKGRSIHKGSLFNRLLTTSFI